MFTTYAIRSISRNYVYIGLSNDVQRRLSQHNKGYNRTTKAYCPFRLIYTKEFGTRPEAREHEKYLKSSKGRDFLRFYLVQHNFPRQFIMLDLPKVATDIHDF